MAYNKNSLYTREDLLNFGIYELRDLGREVGVHSPTTLKKADLVDNILSIIYGETPRQVIGKGRGRPARAKDKLNNIFVGLVNEVKEPAVTSNIVYPDFETFSTKDLLSSKVASQAAAYVNDNAENPDKLLRSGVVCEENGNHYIRKLKFIKSASDYMLSDSIYNYYNLKENDRVEYIVDEENQEMVQIFKVNGDFPNRAEGLSIFQEKKGVSEVYIGDFKILMNKSNLIYSATLEDRALLVDTICSWFKKSEYNTVKVCFDRTSTTKSEALGVITSEIFSSCIGDEYETMAMIEEGIDKAVFFSLLNNKSVLVLDNFAWLVKVINTYPESIYGNFIEKMIKTCKNSNITLICISSHLKNETIQELSSLFEYIKQ